MIAETLSSIASGLGRMLPYNATLENPTLSLSDPGTWDQILGGATSDADVKVSHHSAMEFAPVWQAVSLISGDLACMPLVLYRRLPDQDREPDRKNPLAAIVADAANDETPAFEFWRRLMVHALLWGNGYAFITRKNGRPAELLNLLPDRTAPNRDEAGGLFYVTEVDGKLVDLKRDDVLHIKGLSMEPGVGCDLVERARNSWGLGLAAEKFNSRFFSNGANAGGILTLPPEMSEVAKTKLESDWKSKYTGRENWFRTIVLRDGAKFHETTIDAERSQLHEVREDQVRDVARWFNLPPFKLGLSDSVSYNSIEQSQLVYLMSALNHWRVAITSECKLKLLTESERRTHFFEHNVSKLIEIDSKTMNEVLEIQRRNEIINADEWRRKLNLNKRPDGGGGEYINPNTKSADSPAEPDEDSEPDTTDQENRLRVFRQAVDRMAGRVCNNAKRAAKSYGKFLKWLDESYDSAFLDIVAPSLALLMDDYDQTLLALDAAFYETLTTAVAPLVEPPHTATDWEKNVGAACDAFEATIADRLIKIVLGDDHA